MCFFLFLNICKNSSKPTISHFRKSLLLRFFYSILFFSFLILFFSLSVFGFFCNRVMLSHYTTVFSFFASANRIKNVSCWCGVSVLKIVSFKSHRFIHIPLIALALSLYTPAYTLHCDRIIFFEDKTKTNVTSAI